MVLSTVMKSCREVGYRRALRALERSLIMLALRMGDGNRAEAARHLGMNRTTLVMRIKALGIKTELH